MRNREVPLISLKPLQPQHWEAARSIYLEGIATGLATFETAAPSWDDWEKGHLPFARIVAISPSGSVEGWAALSPVSNRLVYAGVAEVSVYVAARARGRGLGRVLLERLVHESEQHRIWTLQASIFPENQASLKLHRRYGFNEVGVRRRIGKLQGVWRDTLLLERRSTVTGTE